MQLECGKEGKRVRDRLAGVIPTAKTPEWGRCSARSYGMNDIN